MGQSFNRFFHQLNRDGHGDRFLAANLSIGLGHFLVLFNGGAYLPMIPKIAGSLGRDPSYGVWTQDLYFLGLGLALPLAPWVRARWGQKDGLLLAFALFAAASAVNAVSSHFAVFLGARIVAAVGGGLSIPLSLGQLLAHYHERGKKVALLLWGWACITPFAFGPFLGGVLADTWGWRWLFVLDVPLALLVFLGIALWEEPDREFPPHPMDWPGYLFLVLALGSALMILNSWDTEGWWDSGRTQLLLALAATTGLAFLLWSAPHPRPVIPLRLFRRQNFALAALGIWLTALLFQGSLAILVIQYQLHFGFSAYRIGLPLLSMALFAPLSAAFSHWYLRHHDPRWLSLAAMLLLGGAAFWMASWALPVSPEMLIWPPLLIGLGLGAVFSAWARMGLLGLTGAEEVQAASLLNLLRTTGQAMGLPALATFWERRADLHRHFLIADPNQNQVAWQMELRHFASIMTPRGARDHLAGLLAQQADMLAFNEVFWIAAWGFLALAFLSLLLRRPPVSGEPLSEQMAIEEMVEP
ncbi:MFS transporter [Acidithiobacillus sp. M4-SHS-6]|uniref:MFS transporter n=1 Tax=Acidithiobacillus sp. M4-SHS-6 TaxID=3383024 RepID=UPI0039BDF982